MNVLSNQRLVPKDPTVLLKNFYNSRLNLQKKIEQKRMTLKQNLELKKEEKNTFMPKTNNKTQ